MLHVYKDTKESVFEIPKETHMNKKSIVLLLSLALLMVSGALYAAGGQRGAWITDETQDTQWTPRWMSEQIDADQTRGPRGTASQQYPAAADSPQGRMGRGYTIDSQRSAAFSADTRRAYTQNQMMSHRGPVRQDSASSYDDRDTRQRQLRTPADECCYPESAGRGYQNQTDEGFYGRGGTTTRRSMMR